MRLEAAVLRCLLRVAVPIPLLELPKAWARHVVAAALQLGVSCFANQACFAMSAADCVEAALTSDATGDTAAGATHVGTS